jgi:hypothetical protein
MRYCEDSLKDMIELGNGVWKKGKNRYFLMKCQSCGEDYLGKEDSKYCSKECFSNRSISQSTKDKMREKATGRVLSEDTKQKISEKSKLRTGKRNPFYGRVHTEETKKRISESRTGKGKKRSVYTEEGIPLYDTYAEQLKWCEEVRRNDDDPNVLEVRCTHCDKWMVPSIVSIYNRIQYLKGNKRYRGENRFYCSEHCKSACPLYAKSPEQLMKEDAVRAGRLEWLKMDREVQHELREMVLKRDKYRCVKCGATESLQCHHIDPVAVNPIESADIDNCMTLCEHCHKQVHQQDGCRYGQLRQCI